MLRSPADRDSPRARWLRAGLALELACSLVLLPLSGLLHLAFATHEHHYCAEHHRFEDLPWDDGRERLAAHAPTGDSGSPGLGQDSASAAFAHLGCPVLNLSSASGQLGQAPLRPATTIEAAATPIPARRPEPLPSCPLLRRAPKTPPPLLAV